MAYTAYDWRDGGYTLSGTAGDLITLLDGVLVTGEGWTKAYSGTNKAAYQNGAGQYLRVQDDAPVTATTARITGYSAMTDVDTGSNAFPSTQYYIRKSATADTVQRPWQIFADADTFLLFIRTGDQLFSAANWYWHAYGFGDYYAYHTIGTTAYNPEAVFIAGDTNENNSTTTNNYGIWSSNGDLGSGGGNGIRTLRGYNTGTAGNQTFAQYSWSSMYLGYLYGQGAAAYPEADTGKVMAGRRFVADSASVPPVTVRGHMRELYAPVNIMEQAGHHGALQAGAAGTEYEGKTFMLLRQGAVGAANSSLLMETTWSANP